MSRLSDALNRAVRATGDPSSPRPVAGTDSTSTAVADVEQAWNFDTEESHVEIPPEPPADLPPAAPVASMSAFVAEEHPELSVAPPPTPVRSFQYNFGEATQGKAVSGPEADGTLVEQYRRLCAVLHQSQVHSGIRTVMIASAVASEGKTLTATNLALTLSQSFQRRVLLIDADLRKPSLHGVFQLPNGLGLGDVLLDPLDGQLPLQCVSSTLWVLTAGRPNPDPMSGLVSNTMKQVLIQAAEQFDWVIIDTPPMGVMPDAHLLAGMIDSALLVVRASSTPYPFVQRAVEAIGRSRIIGVVLNRTEELDITGEHGYYGYYKAYGAPAEISSQPKKGLPGLGLFKKKQV
jgi:capsular exopolysaccharide synthesis family protein